MTNLEKEKWFLVISKEQNNKAEITPVGNQSLQILLPCGCKQTQHKYAGDSKRTLSKEQVSARSQFFEFCKNHS